jgi:signal transduction histidine kinase
MDDTMGSTAAEQLERIFACYQQALGHELPNQLIAILGLLRMLQLEEGDRLGADGRDYLQRVSAVTQRARLLIGDLAEMTRLVRGASSPGAAPANTASLPEMAREAVAAVNQLYPGQVFEYDIIDPCPLLPVADATLRQLLVRLLRFALRHHGRRPGFRVEIGARSRAEGLELWLADNGEIAAGTETFEPFGQGGGEDTESGLDLFLCSLIATGWGGSLKSRSTPGQGHCFTIELPGNVPPAAER